jgi:hypothetical protein
MTMLSLMLSPCDGATAGCDLFQITPHDAGSGKQVYEDRRTPWRVTIDLQTAEIEVARRAGSGRCKTSLDDVSGVYMGQSGRIVFRTAEVASEQLFTIDAATCRDIGKPVNVDEARSNAFHATLRTFNICH